MWPIGTDLRMVESEYQQVLVDPDAPTDDNNWLAEAREQYLGVKML